MSLSLVQVLFSKQLMEASTYSQKARIQLFYQTLVIGFLVGVIGTFIGFAFQYSVLLSLGVLCMTVPLLAIFLLKKTQSIKPAAILLNFAWIIGLGWNIIFLENTLNFSTILWLLIINIIITYVLGFYYFLLSAALTTIILFHYFTVGVYRDLFYLQNAPRIAKSFLFIESTMVIIVLGYLLWTIIESSKKSDELLQQQNFELTQQNQTISQGIKEKEVMIKEIHHRVKNNLQVIISLLRLQMNEIPDLESRAKFNESVNRIITMSMIHEKIYQSDRLDQINLQEYFVSLSNEMISSSHLGDEIGLDLSCEIKELDLKHLVPLALIVHELISNSLKHAFEDVEQPKITLHLSECKTKNEVYLLYADNGKWKVPTSEESLGSKLIESFTEQLNGHFELKTNEQTSYSFLFKDINIPEE
jgi:two-component sensor histidine kinase